MPYMQIRLMCRYKATTSAYMMNSLQSTIRPEKTHNHNFHINDMWPDQICMPLHTYMYHYVTEGCIYFNITAHINKNHYKCNLNSPCYCHICASNKYAPLMPYISHIPKLLPVHQWGCWSIYIQHMNHWHQPWDKECFTWKTIMPTVRSH